MMADENDNPQENGNTEAGDNASNTAADSTPNPQAGSDAQNASNTQKSQAEFADFSNEASVNDAVNRVLNGEDAEKELEAIYDVPVELSAVLGRSIMPVNQLLRLGRGAVVELDRKVGEAIDIYVNNRLVARGEVVMMHDRLGVTMTEIIKGDAHH